MYIYVQLIFLNSNKILFKQNHCEGVTNQDGVQHSKKPPEIAIMKASNRECNNLKRTARENYNYTLIHTRSIINNRTA